MPLAFNITKQKKKNNQPYQKEKKELKTQICEKLFSEPLEPYTKILECGSIEILLAMRTYSEANSVDHWQKKHRRHKSQKNTIFWTLLEIKHLLKLPCLITLTRYAPRELDFYDNLPMSFKWILDSISDTLIPGLKSGRADNDKRIRVKYDQIKNKKYFIKIEFDFSDST